MKSKTLKIAFGWVFLIGFLSHAWAGCESPKAGYDTTYCTAKLFIESDDELNSAYSSLRSLLTDKQKQILKRSQLAWIKYRDLWCSQSTDGGVAISTSCSYKTNKTRTKFLLDRVTECKIGACSVTQLSRTDFRNQ